MNNPLEKDGSFKGVHSLPSTIRLQVWRTAAAFSRRINTEFSKGTGSEHIAQSWLARFRNVDINIRICGRLKRPSEVTATD